MRIPDSQRSPFRVTGLPIGAFTCAVRPMLRTGDPAGVAIGGRPLLGPLRPLFFRVHDQALRGSKAEAATNQRTLLRDSPRSLVEYHDFYRRLVAS